MSYFRYAERSADTQINWAQVGKDMSDMLKEEVRIREEKKAAIDKASREFGEELANAPTGDYDAGNTFALDHAQSAQEFRLMQDRLLKSGQLKVRDYTIGRQNIIDGTKNLFGLAEEYQTEYAEKMKRWEGDESAYREMWEAETVEGLANLRQVKSYTNPTNGVVSIGKMVKNPKTGVMEMSKNPTDFATVNELRQRLKQKYDRFDMNGTASAAANQLGVLEESAVQIGGTLQLNTILTMIDAKRHNFGLEGEEFAATYKDWETTQVSAMMRNPNDVASVLTDKVLQTPEGNKYTFTFDKKEFDADKTGSLIYLDRTEVPAGVPVFKKDQEKIVQEQLRLAIRANIDVKRQTKGAGFTPQSRAATPTEVAIGDRNRNQNAALNNFGQLFYGNAAQKFEAANNLRALNKDIEAIEPTADGIIIRYTDASGKNDEPLSYGTDLSRFIKQGVNFVLSEGQKIQNVDDILKRSKYQEMLGEKVNTVKFKPSRGIAKARELSFPEAFTVKNEVAFNNDVIVPLLKSNTTLEERKKLKNLLQEQLANIEGIEPGDITVELNNQKVNVTLGKNEKFQSKFEMDLSDPTDAASKLELIEKAGIEKGILRFSNNMTEKDKQIYRKGLQSEADAFKAAAQQTNIKFQKGPSGNKKEE